MSAAITLQWINAASIPADVMAKIDGKQVKSAFLTKHSDNAKVCVGFQT